MCQDAPFKYTIVCNIGKCIVVMHCLALQEAEKQGGYAKVRNISKQMQCVRYEICNLKVLCTQGQKSEIRISKFSNKENNYQRTIKLA